MKCQHTDGSDQCRNSPILKRHKLKDIVLKAKDVSSIRLSEFGDELSERTNIQFMPGDYYSVRLELRNSGYEGSSAIGEFPVLTCPTRVSGGAVPRVFAEYAAVGNSSGAVHVAFYNAEFPSETGAAVTHSVSYMLEYYLQPAGSTMLSDYDLRNTVQEYQWIKVKPSNTSFPHCNKPITSHEYYSSGHERSCGLDSHWNTRSQTYEPPEPERN